MISNGDFEEYWRYHLAREHQRLYPGTKQGTIRTRRLSGYLTPEELHPKAMGLSSGDRLLGQVTTKLERHSGSH